jgi:hypothetical protein
MNTSNLLSPARLDAVAIFTVATSVFMVAAHTGMLALAADRAGLAPAKKFGVPLLAAALLSGWLAWAVLAVGDRVATPEPVPLTGQLVQQPALLLEMAVFVALGAAALFASKTVRELNAAMPPEWLIGVQTYRVAGAMFLWPFLAVGALPAAFALPAGIGDTITGLAAPLVALAVARNRPGARAWAVAWNLFGILDLIVAPATAVLTQSTNISRFPLVVVPLFLGPPIGILTHIYSLRNLRTNRPQTATEDQARTTFSASPGVFSPRG